MNNTRPVTLTGSSFKDERGIVSFNNELNIDGFKRIYFIINETSQPFRGWHGHEFESKIFMVKSGAIRFGAVRVENWNTPDPSAPVITAEITEDSSSAFFVPGGYANGILSLIPGSVAMVLSSSSLEESKADDYRIAQDFWRI